MLVASLLALVGFALSSVRALTMNVPSTMTDSDFNTLTWVTAAGDPAMFAVDIIDPNGGRTNLLTTVNTSDEQVKFNLPGLQAAKGYTIVAYPVGNPGSPLYTSQKFEVVESRVPTTGSSSSTTTGGASVSNPAGGSATVPVVTGGPAGNTNNAGVPSAPTAAPTFPGTGDSDAAGRIGGSFAVAAIGALAAVLAF